MNTMSKIFDTLKDAKREAQTIADYLESSVGVYKNGDGYSLWNGDKLLELVSPQYDELDYHGI